MKRPGDPSTLTVIWWDGEEPVAGDAVETRTGRRYLILRVRYRRASLGHERSISALDTVVLDKHDAVPGVIHPWRWAPRTRRARRFTWGQPAT
jgi:hypothetical protein